MGKTFDKLIIHTSYEYIRHALDGGCYQEAGLRKVKNALTGLNVFYKFTPQEHKKLGQLGETETAINIRKVEIDYSVFAMSILNEYVTNTPKKDRIKFNVSDENIKSLMAKLVKDMLSLKLRNKEKYDDTKRIVEDSKQTAKRFYNFFENELKETK